MFFQRITFDFSDIVIGPGNTKVLERAIAELATRFGMKWQVHLGKLCGGTCVFPWDRDDRNVRDNGGPVKAT